MENLKLSNKELLESAGAIAPAGSLAFVELQLKLDRDVALAQPFSNGIELKQLIRCTAPGEFATDT